MYGHEEQEAPEWNGPSRSAKKRAAKAVEVLAVELLELPDAAWSKVPVPDELREEIDLARRTESYGARKRQMKHLAGVLRRHEDEMEAIQAFLGGLHQVQLRDARDFHFIEALRDQICDREQGVAGLDEALTRLPGLDRAALTRLARAVHTSGDRKAFREIFRRLKSAWEQAGDTP